VLTSILGELPIITGEKLKGYLWVIKKE